MRKRREEREERNPAIILTRDREEARQGEEKFVDALKSYTCNSSTSQGKGKEKDGD